MKNPFKKQAAVPLELSQWYADDVKVAALRSFVNDPAFKVASATLKNLRRPTRACIGNDERTASDQLAFYAGYCEALEEIVKISTVPKKQNQNIQEWKHIQE